MAPASDMPAACFRRPAGASLPGCSEGRGRPVSGYASTQGVATVFFIGTL
ncbi:hypothetical protein [Burkholderia cepacia]